MREGDVWHSCRTSSDQQLYEHGARPQYGKTCKSPSPQWRGGRRSEEPEDTAWRQQKDTDEVSTYNYSRYKSVQTVTQNWPFLKSKVMKSKVRLGCVCSTDLELGQGRSWDLISWPFRDIPNELCSEPAVTRLVWQNEINNSGIISSLLQIVTDLLLADTRQVSK